MGMAPIIDGMGLIITVLSYNGMITLSPTSDIRSMPELDKFTVYLRESANELEAEILKWEKTGKKKKPTKTAKPKSDAVFNNMKKYLKDNPEFLKKEVGKFQFNITGDATGAWKVDLSKPPGRITRGTFKEADATFTVQDKYLVRIGNGDLSLMNAFIQGRLSIDGDNAKAMKLGKILSLILADK